MIFQSFSALTLSDLPIIFTLVLLEGLLSADNALVLAVLVKDLKPEALQKKAMKIGIWFAYAVRFLCVFIAGSLLHYSFVKWGAALYLLYIAGHGLLIDADESNPDETIGEKIAKRLGLSPFVQAVVAVELADIAFSVDSITAALAFSTKLAVVFIGGCLGILAMRYAAGIFLSLIQRYPLLNKVAFLLVGIIGLKLFVGAGAFPGFFGLDWIDLSIEVPEWLGLSAIFGTFIGSIGIAHFLPNSRIAQWGSVQTHELAEEIEEIRGDNK